MKALSSISALNNLEKPTLACSQAEYVDATTEEDGTILYVIDETTHTVVAYKVAYNGYWNTL